MYDKIRERHTDENRVETPVRRRSGNDKGTLPTMGVKMESYRKVEDKGVD